MSRSSDRLTQLIFIIASILYIAAVFFRTLLTYQKSEIFTQILGLLLLFICLYASESILTRRYTVYFPIYLVIQTGLAFYLLGRPGNADYFGALFNLLSLQVMTRLSPRLGAAWIAVCTLGMVWILYQSLELITSISLALVYTAGSVFLGSYTLATRRSQVVRKDNHSLAVRLEDANRQLQDYTAQLEFLAVARERSHLARELHDSVTQTVFSMTLVIQAALLSLDRNPLSVSEHLERLSQLSRSALSEMQILIDQLGPETVPGDGLLGKIRILLSSKRFPADFTVSLEVDGDNLLDSDEEKNLFRIAEEALNNCCKHALTSQAVLRLHLSEPFWMEIQDQGQGFDLFQVRGSSQFGLLSMAERAAEIGWSLQINTNPGAGTSVRVEKASVKEGLA